MKPQFQIDEINDNGRETIWLRSDCGVMVRLTYEGESIVCVDVDGYDYMPNDATLRGIYIFSKGEFFSLATLISEGAIQLYDLIEEAQEDARAAEKAERELRSDYYAGVL